ncbi:TPA: hypothetical protein N0F65_011756 [Lagenidium giganteum]|uniref:non-specific serine/threonine protein kinase n=1 Tax=Lagenidium giganteum TaxID=4803 RepID=A0AAV2YVX1_9STRA|nr:TPA: hypothetical protein N0F65_011756 [Lagenidium giganteum]
MAMLVLILLIVIIYSLQCNLAVFTVDEHCLGRGNQGQVFKARHKCIGSPCAIKIARNCEDTWQEVDMMHKVVDLRGCARIQNAWAASKLEVLAAIPTFEDDDNSECDSMEDAEDDDNLEYEALEEVEDDDNSEYDGVEGVDDQVAPDYVVIQMVLYGDHGATGDSSTLKEWVTATNRSREDKLAMFHRIVATVDKMHERCIVHRDLKPQNIVIHDNEPRIIDFGCAYEVDPKRNGSHGGIGTPGYWPPEQQPGASGIHSPKGDIYSLGICLLEICHPCTTCRELNDAVMNVKEQRKYPQTLGKFEGELILSMTEQDPGMRPSAKDVRVKLERHMLNPRS